VGGLLIGDTGDIDTGTEYHGRWTPPRSRCGARPRTTPGTA
jgi:hypothetical protein